MATVIDELEIKVNSHGLDALLAILDKVSASFKEANKTSAGFKTATAAVARSTEAAGKAAHAATGKTKAFVASIARIAKYRLIRAIIRGITDAVKEGAQNFYNFSKAVGAPFAAAMDKVKSSASTMKNQVGSAFGELYQAVAPIINALISLITRLASVLSMMFAKLGGKSGWYKAADGASALGDAVGGAGGAAKKALRYLAPFDELNVLPDQSGGGGGGGGGISDMESAMYEWQEFADQQSWEEIKESIITTMSDVVSSITDTFNNASEWLANVDWANVGAEIYTFLSDAFSRVDWIGLASSIFRFLGTSIGATVSTVYGFLEAAARDTAEYFKEKTTQYLDEGDTWYEKGALAAAGFLEGVYDKFIDPAVTIGHDFLDGLFDGLGLDYDAGKAEVELALTAHPDSQFEQFMETIGLLTGQANQPTVPEIEVPVTIKRGEHTEESLYDFFFGSGESNKRERDIDINVNTTFTMPDNAFVDFLQGDNEVITATVGLEKSPEWSGGTVSDWIKNVQQWGANLFKDIGLERGKDSNGRLWTDLTSWIRGNFWGDDLNKAVGIAQPNGNRWGTVYKWIRGNYWGDDLNKAIYIAQPNGKRWGTVAAWIQNATNWGGTPQKEVGLTKQKSGDGAWTTVSEWIKKAKNWGETVIKRIIELAKGWKGTVTDWVKQSDNYGTGSAYVNVYVTRHVREVQDGQIGGGAIRNGATGGVFANGRWNEIARYASGGILGTGSQLFWAREAGPELVGTLGGHTAVMNNDQIVASVSNGVAKAIAGIRFRLTSMPTYSGGGFSEESLYNAFVRALADTNETIELDGEVVYRKMLGRNRQETYRTGNNPMMTMA